MTVQGFDRLLDLIGIAFESADSRDFDQVKENLDEMQGIVNNIPKDNDTTHVLQGLFRGHKLPQVLAQLEVMKNESPFVNMLLVALHNDKVKNELAKVVDCNVQ